MLEKQFICEVLATELADTGVNRRDHKRICHWTVVYATDEEAARRTILEAYARSPYHSLEEIGCVRELTPEVKEKIDAEID